MKKVSILTAAVLAAVIFFLLLTLPPRPLPVTWTGYEEIVQRTVVGAYHVHSVVSDGLGDKAAIAAAAARAGLKFVILTDHGDGTRAPDAPAYIQGVLLIDAVEISTTAGHYVALDLTATPYPLGGEPAAVVEDVHRFGGFGFVAHPDSPKPQLAWTDWSVPLDGIEWLNGDSEWRDESRTRLARVLFDYVFRPGPAMASLLDRPVSTLARWDRMTALRPVVAIAGHDAHGGIGRTQEDGRRSVVGRVPSYEASFRAFGVRAILDSPLTGNPAEDSTRVVQAIRRGHLFTVIDGTAAPGFLDFRAIGTGSGNQMGDTLRPGRATLSVLASLPPQAELILIHNGADWIHPPGARFETSIEAASGAYRVEVRVPGAPGSPPVPWLVSNPIYFLPPRSDTPPPPRAADPEAATFPQLAWHVEKDPGSTATFVSDAAGVRLEYRLKPGDRASQYAALAGNLDPRRSFGQVAFVARASKPMRVSVQLRFRERGGVRWGHSVFVDPTPRDNVVSVDQLMPADHQDPILPDTARADTVLFVVDLTNALPGDAGVVEISRVRLGR